MRLPEGLPKDLIDARVTLQEIIPVERPAPEHLAALRRQRQQHRRVVGRLLLFDDRTMSDVTVDAAAAEVQEKEAEETGATVEAVNGLDERAVASMVAMMVVAVQLLQLLRVPLMSVEVGRAATLLPPVLLAEGSALPLLAPTRCVSLGPRTK